LSQDQTLKTLYLNTLLSSGVQIISKATSSSLSSIITASLSFKSGSLVNSISLNRVPFHRCLIFKVLARLLKKVEKNNHKRFS
ncbi:MAG: hypothetical protein IJ731_03375, partial [Eubacterium sp.]|nr:hypothetical protein [Eubacterium sp.]